MTATIFRKKRSGQGGGELIGPYDLDDALSSMKVFQEINREINRGRQYKIVGEDGIDWVEADWKYRVHIGYTKSGNDRYARFPDLASANEFCDKVMREKGTILSVERIDS